ncbi:MAG: hypothetical protein JXB62_00845 [Pirellulales bacterium]|nr:hypothetical protein [Pirellulales bacterium]
MAEPSIDIDRIVRDVVAELGLGPEAGSPVVAPPESDGLPAAATTPPRSGDELIVHCRVVTLSELAGRWEAVRRLVVPARAVITPAVRDELRRRKVTLQYADTPESRKADPFRLAIVTVGRRFDPTALVAALGGDAIGVEPQTSDCLIDATDRLAAEVARPDTLGLLLSRHTAAALCLANRHQGVRAISGDDAPSLVAAAEAVGANLLVLDPTAHGLFPLKHRITEFCRGGVRCCPEAFRQRLG